ncbi:MAG TPA: hypothetical protein VMU84_20925, partial [Thermoanaerobaculia bacterium]|nr:hypothetical protein [Thermoanaerobaculia bacterium]
MELDELKHRWAEYDRKLDASIRLNTALLRESTLHKAGSALNRLSLLLAIELVINFALVLLLGSFIGDHLGELRFVVPAAFLHVCTLALIATAIQQLVTLRTLDFDAPVIEIQKKLESLRVKRIQITKWVLLLAPLLWTPLVIVSLKMLFDFDAYALQTWLIANLLFGVAVIPLMLLVSKRYADRFRGSPVMRRLMDDIAGRNLIA